MDSWIISEYLAQTQSARITLAYESPKARMRREWEGLCKRVQAAGLKPAGSTFWALAMVARIGNRRSASAMP
jgi:hypothetical protein